MANTDAMPKAGPDLERPSQKEIDRLTGILETRGYPLHLKEPLSKPSGYVPRVKLDGLASAMVYEFKLDQPGGDIELIKDQEGSVVAVRVPTTKHQQAAYYHEY